MVNAPFRAVTALSLVFFFPFVAACVSLEAVPPATVPPVMVPPVVDATPAPPQPPVPALPAAQQDTAALAEMDGLLAKARDSADSNHLSEAIRGFVSVIAVYDEGPSPERRAKAETAAAELAKIGGRLSLEPAGEWVDPKGTQLAGATRSAGKEGGLNPAVYLFESFGMGKSPVPDASIYFEFVKNAGSLVQLVTTDAYGKANTTIARIDEPGKEAVVRAYPLFRARGKAYAFKSVFRDFAYLPPANVAKVAALESSELGAADNPQVVDALISALKPLGLQLSPLNGKLAPEAFRQAFGGDAKALADLGGGASYTAFVLAEVADIRQMELNGVKYNIFTAATKLTFRLVRADGTAVYALPLEAVKGQGGTREAAVADGFKRAREAMVPAIQRSLPAMQDALNKE